MLIITSKYDIMVLSCETNDDGTYEIITKSHGNLKETVSRASNYGFLCSIEPRSSFVSVKCYDGIIKFISFGNEGKQLNFTTMRYSKRNSFFRKFKKTKILIYY